MDYTRVSCSTSAFDGALRGCVVGGLWGAAEAARGGGVSVGVHTARSATFCGTFLAVYSGLRCSFQRLAPPDTPSWPSSALAGACAGSLWAVRGPHNSGPGRLRAVSTAALLSGLAMGAFDMLLGREVATQHRTEFR